MTLDGGNSLHVLVCVNQGLYVLSVESSSEGCNGYRSVRSIHSFMRSPDEFTFRRREIALRECRENSCVRKDTGWKSLQHRL